MIRKVSYSFLYGCATEHATKFKDEIKLNDRAGYRHNPTRRTEAAVAEKAVAAARNPRDAGTAPQARPKVGCLCQYNGVGINDTY